MRSPLEFFISIILLLIIIIAAYRFAVKYFFDERGKSGWINFIPALIFYTFLFLVSLRGFESSIRSVIFDSTLLFFKEKDLVPALPAVLMQLNILILGVAVLTLSAILIILVFKRLPSKFRTLMVFSFLFLFFQIAGMFYDLYQVSPQGTHLIRIIYIIFAFVIAYVIIFSKQVRNWTFVYITFAASFISITLLNHYNSELERASVSLITNELAQPRENWIDFLVNETLNFAKAPENLYPVSNKKNINFDALAFSVWSRSSLKRESIVSAVAFIDSGQNILGKFIYGMKWNKSYGDITLPDKQILRNDSTTTGEIYVVGTVPVKLNGKTISFVVSALENGQGIPVKGEPDFLTGKRLFESAAVNVENLLIFEITGDRFTSLVGDVNVTPAQINYIKNNLVDKNETRLNIVSNNEVYSAYVVKNGEKIIAAAQKEKEISWSLLRFLQSLFHTSVFSSSF